MKSDSCLHKALVCHDMSNVFTYSSKKWLVWLINESPKIILKDNNMVWGSYVHKLIENIRNIDFNQVQINMFGINNPI